MDAYLSGLPAESRGALERLRNAIQAAAPEAEPGMSYGVPAFRFRGKALVCFAAFKNHCGFCPLSPEVLRMFSEELAGFDIAKGTIRFHTSRPLPVALLTRIVRARLAELRD